MLSKLGELRKLQYKMKVREHPAHKFYDNDLVTYIQEHIHKEYTVPVTDVYKLVYYQGKEGPSSGSRTIKVKSYSTRAGHMPFPITLEVHHNDTIEYAYASLREYKDYIQPFVK